ncbi:hypothetical protein [Bacillus pseudomycoides]|uniref:hypothetical protein n=1 Tax=Bacillus pseudomycoides TaxID=64104 RepID=UPI002B461258|nr:hypothetical protein [Bacillus pseudomycoides]MEB3057599.1 hypothetical protein [Bacillus pseudomycoides]
MFKKLVVGALATGIALTGGIGAASADTVKPVSSPNKATETAYSENQQYISDRIESIVENTSEVERPFVPNFSDKNNLIGEKAAVAFDWRYSGNYNFSTSIQVKKTISVANNGNIGVGIQNNKNFNFKVVVKSLSSGNTVTHTVKGGPMSGGDYVTDFFGPMKAGDYVVTLVNTDGSWHQGLVWLGW